MIVLVGFMSKEWMKIDSESTFSGGSFGCIAGFATGSVTQVALTGYGYLYLNVFASDIKKASVKRLGL